MTRGGVGCFAAIFFTAAACLSTRANAQNEVSELSEPVAVELEKFRLSGTPALGLLGVSAASVLRPNTPRDLIASLVSGAGSDGIVPDGFSLETAPYWLVRHRALDIRRYHHATLVDRLRYFTAISVATSRARTKPDTVASDAYVAIAIRTLLANGRPSAALRAVEDSLRMRQIQYIERFRRWESSSARAAGVDGMRTRLMRQEELLSSLVTRVLVGPQTALRDSAMRTLGRRDSLRALVASGEAAVRETARLEDEMDRAETRLAALAKRFAEEEIEPDGFVLELAVGTRGRFERAQWASREMDGAGVWITPMYRSGGQGVELIGVARYLSGVEEYEGRNLLDFGGRAGIDIGAGALSAEHVWRSLSGSGRSRTARWSILFDYPIGGKIWAAASFGSDYRRSDGSRPAIATIGLNLGFGAIEILPSDRRR